MFFRASSPTLARLDFTLGDAAFCFITAHFCHAERPDDEYEAALFDLEGVLNQANREKRTVVVGVDANAVLGKRLPSDDKDVIGAYGMGPRNSRGHQLAHWLHGVRLAPAGLLFDAPWDNMWTHRL